MVVGKGREEDVGVKGETGVNSDLSALINKVEPRRRSYGAGGGRHWIKVLGRWQANNETGSREEVPL